ncbi:hypothetical protein pb186bvf_014004 [Paramecium bursaria]
MFKIFSYQYKRDGILLFLQIYTCSLKFQYKKTKKFFFKRQNSFHDQMIIIQEKSISQNDIFTDFTIYEENEKYLKKLFRKLLQKISFIFLKKFFINLLSLKFDILESRRSLICQ